jgi:4-hydroxy-tetrahydrodipicolinate synthase
LGVGDTRKIVEELQTRDFSSFIAILSVSPFYKYSRRNIPTF